MLSARYLLYLFFLIKYSYLLAYSCKYTYPYAHTLFLAETLHTHTTATLIDYSVNELGLKAQRHGAWQRNSRCSNMSLELVLSTNASSLDWFDLANSNSNWFFNLNRERVDKNEQEEGT